MSNSDISYCYVRDPREPRRVVTIAWKVRPIVANSLEPDSPLWNSPSWRLKYGVAINRVVEPLFSAVEMAKIKARLVTVDKVIAPLFLACNYQPISLVDLFERQQGDEHCRKIGRYVSAGRLHQQPMTVDCDSRRPAVDSIMEHFLSVAPKHCGTYLYYVRQVFEAVVDRRGHEDNDETSNLYC